MQTLTIPMEVWGALFLLIQIINTVVNNKFARKANDLEDIVSLQKDAMKILSELVITQYRIADTLKDVRECVRGCPTSNR